MSRGNDENEAKMDVGLRVYRSDKLFCGSLRDTHAFQISFNLERGAQFLYFSRGCC